MEQCAYILAHFVPSKANFKHECWSYSYLPVHGANCFPAKHLRIPEMGMKENRIKKVSKRRQKIIRKR
jgi:hypothetical protein